MSIEQIEQRVQAIEQELSGAERKLAGWESKRQAALSEFEGTLNEGDESPHKQSSVLSECRFAVNHFKTQIAELKQAKKQARRALTEAKYDEGLQDVRQARREAAQQIAECEDVLVEQIKDLFDAALEYQAEANHKINRFNSRLANALGRPAERQIAKMNSMSTDMWVEAVVREAIQKGAL